MDKLILAMMRAPEWLRVRSVTVETSEGLTTLTSEELEGYAFPVIPFTMLVEVSTSSRG